MLLGEVELISLLKPQFREAELARRQAKQERDRYQQTDDDYYEYQEEYKNFGKIASNIRAYLQLLEQSSKDETPFSHPYYWAAFICSGLA